jgi:viroplasmin and RNaseH domain-containing protein
MVLILLVALSFNNLKNCIMFLNRNECEAQVKGFSGARYKKFSTQNEADEFLNSKNDPCNKQVTNDQALSDENTSMKEKNFILWS